MDGRDLESRSEPRPTLEPDDGTPPKRRNISTQCNKTKKWKWLSPPLPWSIRAAADMNPFNEFINQKKREEEGEVQVEREEVAKAAKTQQ